MSWTHRVAAAIVLVLCLVRTGQAIWVTLPSSGTKSVSEEIQNNVVVLAVYVVIPDDHSTPPPSPSSESAVDKVMLTNESKSGEFHSKISKRLEQVGSQMCQPLLIGAKYLSSGIKRIDTMRLRRAIEQGVVTNANDAQIGSKLPETPALVDKETKAKHVPSFVIINREDFNSDSVPRKAKLVGNSRLSEKEVTERELVLGSGTRKSLHDLS